jgi:hypothetical protein
MDLEDELERLERNLRRLFDEIESTGVEVPNLTVGILNLVDEVRRLRHQRQKDAAAVAGVMDRLWNAGVSGGTLSAAVDELLERAKRAEEAARNAKRKASH